MNYKKITEEEIQKFTLKDPMNKILNLYKEKRDLLGHNFMSELFQIIQLIQSLIFPTFFNKYDKNR